MAVGFFFTNILVVVTWFSISLLCFLIKSDFSVLTAFLSENINYVFQINTFKDLVIFSLNLSQKIVRFW